MKDELPRNRLDVLWQDAASWRMGSVYFRKEDPRVIVPKRNKWMGWTINFANPWALPALILLVLVAAGPISYLSIRGYTLTGIWWATLAAELLIVCGGCAYLSSSRRFR